MELPDEATPTADELLRVANFLKHLGEEHARQEANLKPLQSESSVLILAKAAAPDIQADEKAKTLSLEELGAVPPGIPDNIEAWYSPDADGGKKMTLSRTNMTIHTFGSMPETDASLSGSSKKKGVTWNSLGSIERGDDAFAARPLYVKSEAELARLDRKERANAATDTRLTTHLRRSVLQQFSTSEMAYHYLNKLIRNPTSSIIKRNWDLLGCFLLAYDVFVIPLGSFQIAANPLLTFFEICSLAYWSLDIGMSMTTGYYKDDEDQYPIMDFSLILRHYVCSQSFPFDLTLVTIDWIITITRALNDPADSLSAAGLARVVRVGRVLRLLKLLRVSRAAGFLRNLRRWFTFAYDGELLLMVFDVFKIAGYGFLVFHYMVCVYYFVGTLHGSWISREQPWSDTTFFRQYWVTSNLMSKRVNSYTRSVERDILTDPEILFDMLAYCVSTGFITWFTSTVTSRMLEVARRKRERNEKVDYIRNHYLVQHQIDPRVKLQLLKFMDRGYAEYNSAKLRHKSEIELIEALPVQLARDFRREAWKPVLDEHIFFGSLDSTDIEDICLHTVSEIFSRKHELVFKQKGLCTRMRFVFKGIFAYGAGVQLCDHPASDFFERLKSSDSIPADTGIHYMRKGSWLSEPALWTTSWQYRGSLIAKSTGSFCAISADSLEKALKRHESALHDVVRYATKYVQHLNAKVIGAPHSVSDISDDVMRDAFEAVREWLTDK